MYRILIAGGGGFIGTHLARALLGRDYEVICLDNFLTGRREAIAALREEHPTRLTLIERDARTPGHIDGPLEAVFHLASPASPPRYLAHPLETLECGSTVTLALLRLALAKGARFVLASTSEVYGDPQVHPQPEHYWGNVNPVGPRSVYDESKRFAESLTVAFGARYNVKVRVARIFNTYGPGMCLDDGRVIPNFVTQALRDEPITVYGDGSQTRSFCYVDDLVEGLLRLLWSDVTGPVNLGNDEERSVLNTARHVVAVIGSRSRIVQRPLPADDPRVRRPDLSRARRLLRWSPRTAFESGLARTIDDIRARLQDSLPEGRPVRPAIAESP